MIQDHSISGMVLQNCTAVTLHGPFEQTWTNDQLSFTQVQCGPLVHACTAMHHDCCVHSSFSAGQLRVFGP